MRALLLLLSLSLAPLSEALEIYKTHKSHNSANWTLIYNENKTWIVERVALDSAGWPVLKAKHMYPREDMARAVVRASAATATPMSSIPEDGNELVDPSGETLWTVTNEWSWDWEVKYAAWVSTELDSNWWKRHGLATDCADVAYSARWIFARNNGLPMANRLANGQWFTHRSVKSEWKRLRTAAEWHKDRRFMAALNYFLDFVFTHSLWKDSYPVAINADALRPGGHHLALTSTSGHTQFLSRVGTQPDEVPLLTLNSTIPRQVRDLSEYLFFGRAVEGTEALLRMRWPVWKSNGVSLVDETAMPHYSREQFDPNFVQSPRNEFWEEVFYRLNPNLDFDRVGSRALAQVADLLRARIPIVENGYQACQGNRCPEGTAAWELWSTPTRDARVTSARNMFAMILGRVQNPEILQPQFEERILTQEGYSFTLSQLMTAWDYGLYSSDPNDEPLVRWGVHPRGASIKLSRLYEKELAKREAKIARSRSCRGVACAFGSEKYNRESTFEEDKTLWETSDFLSVYCGHFGADMCADFLREESAILLTSDGRTQSLSQWMKESFYFSSDPRHDRSHRYFSYTKEIPHLNFGSLGLIRIEIFESRMILIARLEQGQVVRRLYVVNGSDVTEWIAPPGETMFALDSSQGWIWTAQDGTLFARQMNSVATKAFALGQTPREIHARGARALVDSGAGLKLLTIEESGGIQAEDLVDYRVRQGNSHSDAFVLTRDSDGANLLLDMDSGERMAFPSFDRLQSLERAGDGYFLAKYNSSTKASMSCAIVSRAGFQDLTSDGHCLAASVNGHVTVNVGQDLVQKTYRDWQLVSELSKGRYASASNKVFEAEDARGKSHFYCATDLGLQELANMGSDVVYHDCSNRFATLYSNQTWTWKIVETATGRATEIAGWVQLASDHDDEHFAYMSNGGLDEMALVDLDHPEKFSILSDRMLWRLVGDYPGRASGLFVYKNGRGVWLKAPL